MYAYMQSLLDKIAQVSSRSLWVLLGVGVSDMPTDES